MDYPVLRTYRFMDKDPVCDEVRTLIQDEGLYEALGKVAILAGIARQTVDKLLNGETKRPQNRTIMAITTGLGYERSWTKKRKFKLEDELEIARAYNVKERKRVAAKRAPVKRATKKRR
jgi:transcriptional regulator with XRE-family HTH domain